MKNRKVRILVSFLMLLIGLELLLRYRYGFGNPVLYKEDKDYEYIFMPNQEVRRLGNSVQTNEYSMRSKPLSSKDRIRILKIGDSIVNGGTSTDHDSLASTLLENTLNERFKTGGTIRVLNIAAGSWGPDNAYAYIQKHGVFGAGLMVLVFSSHDYYDMMLHEKVVGENPSYPSERPWLATQEVITRYIYPYVEEHIFNKPGSAKLSMDADMINKVMHTVNPGWKQFFAYSRKHSIKLLVVLHPTMEEVKAQTYDSKGKHIIAMLDSAGVDRILELDHQPTLDLYRDEIHYNNKGQKFMAKTLFSYLENYVEGNLQKD